MILAFALNGLVALAIGACYAELASAMPQAGGSYDWVKQAMRPRTSFVVGWISLYTNAVAAALYALGLARLPPSCSCRWVGRGSDSTLKS